MKIDESVWKFFQEHLGYTDEEMKRFKEKPRNGLGSFFALT